MRAVERRRGMNGGGGLPYDAEIEYLESSGTQWINSGIQYVYPNSEEFVVDIQFTDIYSRQLNGSGSAFYFGVNNGRWETLYQSYYGTADTNRHLYSKKMWINNGYKQECFLDNTRISSYSASYTEQRISVNGILAHGDGFLFCKAKLYRAKILVNDNIVFDGIPVRKGSVGYLYDMVSKKLFGNSGTGSFILGNDKN